FQGFNFIVIRSDYRDKFHFLNTGLKSIQKMSETGNIQGKFRVHRYTKFFHYKTIHLNRNCYGGHHEIFNNFGRRTANKYFFQEPGSLKANKYEIIRIP